MLFVSQQSIFAVLDVITTLAKMSNFYERFFKTLIDM